MPSPSGRTDRPTPDCPVEVALVAIGGRWTTLVLREVVHGPRTYTQIRAALPAISHEVLSERLAHLHQRGLVHRSESRGFPVRGEYTLTSAGHRLRPLLIELYRTGQDLQREWSRA